MGSVLLVSYTEILKHTELLNEYAAECSIPEIGAINPQPQMYAQLESAGIMQAFAAYEAEKLIGFATVLTTIYPHYGRKVATLESIFVGSQYRKSGAGRELMAAVESYAKEAGCTAILYSAPTGGKMERVLSKRKGMRQTNSVFCLPL